jgi:two-component system, probable response regulator PhcQ
VSTRRHTILVVDDEPEVVETLKRNLRNEPFAVIGTTSPTEALAAIDRGGIDLVIADIDMPEMNGLSLVARIQRTHPDVIRILLTGDASLDSAMTAINESEVHRYLTKPWDTAELREIVTSALLRADELRRSGQAARNVAARDALLMDLEREHPGIRRTAREDGAYVIDGARIAKLARTLQNEELRLLFDTEATLGPRREAGTRRSQE